MSFTKFLIFFIIGFIIGIIFNFYNVSFEEIKNHWSIPILCLGVISLIVYFLSLLIKNET